MSAKKMPIKIVVPTVRLPPPVLPPPIQVPDALAAAENNLERDAFEYNVQISSPNLTANPWLSSELLSTAPNF
jgi:hypothetical protein